MKKSSKKYLFKTIAIASALQMSLPASATQPGAAAGAIFGAVVGNRVGNGDPGSTIAGAIIGGVLGDAASNNQPAPVAPRPINPMPGSPQPVPPPVAPAESRSGVALHGIVRQSGGEWRQVVLNPPIRVNRIEMRSRFFNSLLHQTQLIDLSGRVYPLQGFQNAMLSVNQNFGSSNLSSYGIISAINLRAEAYNGNSDLDIAVISFERTQLSERALQPTPPVVQPTPIPIQPMPGTPQPLPQPVPQIGESLEGYCQDLDHSQFLKAKNFAYVPGGLNMNADGAVNWALEYNQSHACNTADEFIRRYNALYSFAFNSSTLDLSGTDSRNYALSLANSTTVNIVQQQTQVFRTVSDFAYQTTGLDLSGSDSKQIATMWVERGFCGDINTVNAISREFKTQKNLYYPSSNAKAYALNAIRSMSPCTDLFR